MRERYALLVPLIIGVIICVAIAEFDATTPYTHYPSPGLPLWKLTLRMCFRICNVHYSRFPETLKLCKRACIAKSQEDKKHLENESLLLLFFGL
ncbi:uncharacterized protein DS421_2g55980 [Arachis hypogaea]|nr:uncharacterized protein DS421_2g55980 [Arachis hypogaea]